MIYTVEKDLELLEKFQLTPWQLMFLKILAGDSSLDSRKRIQRTCENAVKLKSIVYSSTNESLVEAKLVMDRAVIKKYSSLKKELNKAITDSMTDLVERGIIINNNVPGEDYIHEFEIAPKYVGKFALSVMGMPASLHDAYPHFLSSEDTKKYPAKSCSPNEIAADYLSNIGNDPEEHEKVLEDIKWAISNKQIVMGLVKFVQSKNWLAIREQRTKGYAVFHNTTNLA